MWQGPADEMLRSFGTPLNCNESNVHQQRRIVMFMALAASCQGRDLIYLSVTTR
jgi:hypothetical protein